MLMLLGVFSRGFGIRRLVVFGTAACTAVGPTCVSLAVPVALVPFSIPLMLVLVRTVTPVLGRDRAFFED